MFKLMIFGAAGKMVIFVVMLPNRTKSIFFFFFVFLTSLLSLGLAFCAIMHRYFPEKVPFSKLSKSNPKENIEIAFKSAESIGLVE